MLFVSVTSLFGVYPLLCNIFMAYRAFVVAPPAYGADSFDCYVTALVACGAAAIPAVIGLFGHGLGPKKTMLFLSLQSVVLLFIFAGLYRGYGLNAGTNLISMLNDGEGALYFSIVTWTTLGYGDLVPPSDIRLIAALEALMGNLSFGFLVGLGTYLLCKDKVDLSA
jgi:Ion channel